ncbi:DUF6233 domain-containing protein [Streptomyces tricolor]|uniref:DUF6233 domain-containing protein n=1 Tax=Streptomyces tricolor TaxID=68277 RepID=UPI00382C1238
MTSAHRSEDRPAAAAGRTRPWSTAEAAPGDRGTRHRHRRRTATGPGPRGTCYLAGKRRRPAGREEARRLLSDGTSSCGRCRPDTALGDSDLPLHHRRWASLL